MTCHLRQNLTTSPFLSQMEDRGFEPLEIGYDLCSKPEKVMKQKRVDEHYDFIWLTYVIARKKK